MTAQRIPTPPGAAAVLESCQLFRDLDGAEIEQLAEAVGWLLVPGGEILLRHGEIVESMYVVVSGRLQVIVDRGSSADRVVREIGRGENVGEMALLTGEPSTEAVRAVRDTQLISLSRAHFDQLLERNPRAMMRLARMLARWLQHSFAHSADRGSAAATVAVLPLACDAPTQEFVERVMATELGRTFARVSADRLEARVGPGGSQTTECDVTYAEATHWLNELEREYPVVLYDGSIRSPAWTRRCIRQADRVLAIASGDEAPRDGQLDADVLAALTEHGGSSIDLVLLHSDGNIRPPATAAWRGVLPFASCQHVRRGSSADFGRLARRIAGRSTGVVLGGGGARACGHVGVLRALEEHGIPIDHIGGTSAGALIAAQYAYGYSVDEILELNRRGWGRGRLLKDLTIPLVALLSSRQVKRNLERSFADSRIENLWLPFFCVSTNITRAELTVHREGPLARCVRASLSVPGVLPPVLSPEGDLLVDGAVLNNVPVDVMRAQMSGQTIAVDVSPTARLTFAAHHRETVPPWQLMLRDLRQIKHSRPPTLFRILHQTMLLSSETQRVEAREQADLYLCPPLDQFDLFDWRSLDRMAEVAYRHATAEITRWQHDRLEQPVP